MLYDDCRPSGLLYSSVRMRNISLKKIHIVQRIPLSTILIIDFLKFSENLDKVYQLIPMLFRSC